VRHRDKTEKFRVLEFQNPENRESRYEFQGIILLGGEEKADTVKQVSEKIGFNILP